MKILDLYILKKYLGSFIFTLLILIPIAIAIDIAEKVDKFLRSPDLTMELIIKDYYLNFIVYYANTFMPLALFISTIFFTSKLSNNTEVIAIHSAKISFTRFLRPYFIGASIVTVFALGMNHFIVPHSNKIFQEFKRTYISTKFYNNTYVVDANLQLSETDYIYFRNFNIETGKGYDFSFGRYQGNQLKYKMQGEHVSWNPADSIFSIYNIKKRFVKPKNDILIIESKFDTIFNFVPSDLQNEDFIAKDMTSRKLYKYIQASKERGQKNLNTHIVELHKRTSLPISSFILTLIAVSLSSKKRRGGTGINLAAGIGLMFIYVFFMKITEVLGAVAGTNSFLMVWLPNAVFGVLAYFLYKNANK
ncbi:MAG: LptF/LptG family permease [Flavobacteriaceae bacterium]|nr:LptF/LptG family permease [Flavobacteriaceae bacterium]